MKDDLQILRDQLSEHWGSHKLIEKESGYSKETVRQALQGLRPNAKVLKAAAVVLKRLKQKQQMGDPAMRSAMDLVKAAVAA